MVAVGLASFWGFYGLATWGWCLLKGYNITFGQWFNPMKPYEWPKGGPDLVPAGQVLPTGQGGQGGQQTAARVQVA